MFSPTTPPEIAPAPEAADVESVAALVRRALGQQIEEISMRPSKDSKVSTAKARDARTMADLVRTLERLDALEKRREGKNKKAKAPSDADIKQRLQRRLDQLLASSAKGIVPDRAQRG